MPTQDHGDKALVSKSPFLTKFTPHVGAAWVVVAVTVVVVVAETVFVTVTSTVTVLWMVLVCSKELVMVV